VGGDRAGARFAKKNGAESVIKLVQEAKPMSITMTVREAQADFSKILAQVSQGAEVIIAEDGRPVARVVPASGVAARRRPGSAAGEVVMYADFDAPLPPEVIESFEQ
jgi:prevent-host-death family protein